MDTRVRRLELKIPLDADGYLRRECPNCEREFKRIVVGPSESKVSHPATAGLYCPYCGVQALSNRWLTKSQVALTKVAVADQVADAKPHGALKSLSSLVSWGRTAVPQVEAIELNDMEVVRFTCHPKGPIKVYDGWIGKVHCLVCGASVVT